MKKILIFLFFLSTLTSFSQVDWDSYSFSISNVNHNPPYNNYRYEIYLGQNKVDSMYCLSNTTGVYKTYYYTVTGLDDGTHTLLIFKGYYCNQDPLSGQFTISYPKLSKPTLISPYNTYYVNSYDVLFKWSKHDTATSYDYQISKNNTFTDIVSSGKTTYDSITINVNNLNTIYYWRVRAKYTPYSKIFYSDWSNTFSFTTPDMVTSIIEPSNNAKSNVRFKFKWNAQRNTAIQVAKDNNFTNIVKSYEVNSDNVIIDSLDYSTVYFVRARAMLGNASWSNTIKITTVSTDTKWSWRNPLPNGNHLKIGTIFEDGSILVLGDLATVLKSTDGGLNWVTKRLNTKSNINSIYFPPYETHAFAPGDNGVMYKTTDNGDNWTALNSGITKNLYSVFLADINAGWCVGDNGTIIKTTNGGSSWSSQTSGVTKSLRGVFFPNLNTGWIVGESGTVRKTTDGGVSWSAQTTGDTNTYNGVFFTSTSIGIIFGKAGKIFRTTNGGTNWTSISSGTTVNLNSGKFIDNNNGWIVGDAGKILVTTNGGVNWTSQTSEATVNLNSVHFLDSQNGLAVGAFSEIIKTTDGGSNWLNLKSDVIGNVALNNINFVDSLNGYIIDFPATRYLKTTNGGDSWFTQNIGFKANRFTFINSTTGWAVADTGKIFKTTNSGINWTQQNSNTTVNLKTVDFISTTVGWVAGDNGYLLKTTNGGNSWFSQNVGTSNYYTYINFFDSNRGWISTNTGALLLSTDGGSNWSSVTNPSSGALKSIFFLNQYIGWAVGQNGKLIRTLNGSSWQLKETIFTNLNDVFFVDSLNGWLVGDLIYKTTDGGVNWYEDGKTTIENIKGLYFFNVNDGWSVGARGTILKYDDDRIILNPPSLATPSNNSNNVSLLPNFSWSNQNGAEYYRLEVSLNNTFSTFVFRDTLSVNSKQIQIANKLDTNKVYYWRVKAFSDIDSSLYSNTFTFTTQPKLSTPTLSTPASNATGVSVNANFTWGSVANAANYVLQISTSITFSNLIVNDTVSSTSRTINTTLNGTTNYYWRVKSINEGQAGDWAAYRMFTTEYIGLPVPTLNSPSNNATIVSINPTLNWNTVSGATHYRVQVSTTDQFSSFVLNTTSSTTSQSVSNLSYFTNYYWRLRAVNSTDSSNWSSIWTFKTQDIPLSAVTLSNPSNNSTGIAINTNLSWISLNGATSYDLQLSTSSDFNSYIKNETGLQTNSYSLSNLSNFTVYYWRVRGKNNTETGTWSNVWNFRTISEPLGSPTLSIPSNNATAVSISPSFQWSTVTGATNYELQVSSNSNFTTTVINETNLSSTSFNGSGLSYLQVYYWRARAKNSEQTGNWSSVFSFTTQDVPLGQVTLSTPTNNATGVSISPTLNWNSLSGATNYDLQVATDASFTNIISNLTSLNSTTQDLSNLATFTIHYWRVRAKNTTETGPWSNVWNFRTVSDPLGTPTLSLPTNTATNVSTSPSFQWSSVSGATNYELQVSSNSNFTTTVINETNLSSTSFNGSGLSYLQVYYWRARAKNSEQTGNWSSSFSFTTIPAPPAAPNLSNPSNNATNQATNVSVSWSAVSGATSYKLQISKNSGFTTTVVDESNLTSTSYNNTNLERSTTYYWRVKAVNAGGESAWSSVWLFTTMASEPVPDEWVFTAETGNNATVIVYTTIEPKIDSRDFQTGDAVGAFFTQNGNLVCAGYEVWNGENMALTVWGDDDQTETKDGFEVNENYTFKIWDGQLGRELNAEFTVTSGQSKYTNNGITVLGTLKGVSTSTFNLTLKAGWNIISSYITTQNDSLRVMMTDIKPNINIMKNSAGKVYMPSANIDQIYRWDITQGYQIHMLAADTLPITGMKVNPTATPIIFSTTGWKIASYLRSSTMNVADCMTSLTDRNSLTIAKNNAGKIFLPPSINTIGNMQSGEGYQMYINKADTLIYPANSAGRYSNNGIVQDFDARQIKLDFENTGNNASLILDIDLPDNTELAVMNSDNKIVGAGRVVDGRTAIVLWGDDESTGTIDGAVSNYELRIMNYDVISGKYTEINNLDLTDIISGMKYNKLTYNKDAVLIGKALTQPITLKVSPNPFSNSTEVVYELADDCEIELSLYNLSGMKVQNLASGKQTKGTHKLTLNSEELSSGSYNLILKSCGKSVTVKVVVVK